MKNKLSTALVFVLSFFLIFNSFSISVRAEDDDDDFAKDPIAASGTIGSNISYTYDSSTGTLTLTGTGEIDLESAEEEPGIEGDTELKKVIIKEGITNIPEGMFEDCTALVEVQIAKSVKYIGSEAFAGCTSLTKIEIPEGITRLESATFADCTSLKEITIPKSVTSMGVGLFDECNKLDTINYNGTQEQWNKIEVDLTLNEDYDSTDDDTDDDEDSDDVDDEEEEDEDSDDDEEDPDDEDDITDDIEDEEAEDKPRTVSPQIFFKNAKVSFSDGNTIQYITPSISTSKTLFVYNGKNQKPKITVKDGSKKLKEKTDYDLTAPKKSTKVGNYQITVTLKGKYAGSITISYKIIPKKVSLKKLKSKKKKTLTISWKKSKDISGYEIAYSTSKKFTKKTSVIKTVKKSKKSLTIKKLKSKKKYFVKIRSYKTVGKTKIYSEWSKAKNIKVK